jgi:hypothetical protein
MSLSRVSVGFDNLRAALSQHDLVVNSAGLTDQSRSTSGTVYERRRRNASCGFVRQCRHARLVHVSTCFVNGRTDGRVPEIQVNYTPGGMPVSMLKKNGNISMKQWIASLEAESPALTEQFQVEALGKHKGEDPVHRNSRFSEPGATNSYCWIQEQLIVRVQRAPLGLAEYLYPH